jgi:hypothetical protein
MEPIMGDGFLVACPTVPELDGPVVKFKPDTKRMMEAVKWPFKSVEPVSCAQASIPDLPRLKWGVLTSGARYDSFSGLKFKLPGDGTSLTLGARSTNVSSESIIAGAETQRVGVATLTVANTLRFKYWNDHFFWWWPMGDGGDQGDTAGLQVSYNLGKHGLTAGKEWEFKDLSLTMRLASGVPNRERTAPMGDGEVYTDVQFDSIHRGDIDLSTSLVNKRNQRLDVGLLVNSGAVKDAVQCGVVHQPMGIPCFEKSSKVEVMMYMRLTDF